jgi:hypothetical protein
MRAMTMVFVSGIALAAMSAQAAPLPPRPPGPVIYVANQEWARLPNAPGGNGSAEAAPPIKLVAEGCGPGSHRHHWIDRWGHWHWGHCVPNHW